MYKTEREALEASKKSERRIPFSSFVPSINGFAKGTYLRGRVVGTFKLISPRGIVLLHRTFNDSGLLDGDAATYHHNGSPKTLIKFRSGVEVKGSLRVFTKDGREVTNVEQ